MPVKSAIGPLATLDDLRKFLETVAHRPDGVTLCFQSTEYPDDYQSIGWITNDEFEGEKPTAGGIRFIETKRLD